MPKDYCYPDTNEPHVHVHKGGVTFTNVGHRHKKLQNGNQVYVANCNAVRLELHGRGQRANLIIEWIRQNL